MNEIAKKMLRDLETLFSDGSFKQKGMGYYYIDNVDGRTIRTTDDIIEWGEQFERNQKNGLKRVAHTRIPFGGPPDTRFPPSKIGRGYRVSTVFLGLDHDYAPNKGNPVLWETMVFPGDGSVKPSLGNRDSDFNDVDMARYSSRRDAVIGHWKLVARTAWHALRECSPWAK